METDATTETQETEFSDQSTRESVVILISAGLTPDEIRVWMKVRNGRTN